MRKVTKAQITVKLKTYYYRGWLFKESGRDQVMFMVAAKTKKRIMELLEVNAKELMDFGVEANPEDTETAIKKPETIFWRPMLESKEWYEVEGDRKL